MRMLRARSIEQEIAPCSGSAMWVPTRLTLVLPAVAAPVIEHLPFTLTFFTDDVIATYNT